MADRVRLFVALKLPPDVRSELGRWRGDALAAVDGLRAIPSESLHVTLCFLGSQPVDAVGAIADACLVAGSVPVPHLTLGEPVWLPARRPKVLGVRLDDADRLMGRLQTSLSEALASGGWYAPETRPFLAHVTVCRAQRRARVRAAELPGPAAVSFEGKEVVLFRSRTSSSGARYEPLMTVRVGEGGGGQRREGGERSQGGERSDPRGVVADFHRAQALAYADGEFAPLRGLLHPAVIWHVPGRSAIAGEHRGLEAVLAYFSLRRELTDATFRMTIHGASLIGERVVQLAGGRAIRNGAEVSWETVGVFRVKDGLISECWIVPFDLYEFDQIWR